MKLGLKFIDQLKLLQHQPNRGMAMGCSACPHENLCGGISPTEPIFTCRDLCQCEQGLPCSSVCPKRPLDYVRYVREIDDFDFDRVPRVCAAKAVSTGDYAPLVYGWTRRENFLRTRAVAIPLAMVFSHRNGVARFQSRERLLSRFKVESDAELILTGVDEDGRIEKYWGIGREAGVVEALAALKPTLVTVPNFSLFSNVPRHDNMANMKRIAICWHELTVAGIPAALHLNARTDRDWQRWRDFVRERPEVTWVSFEFGTGARINRRGEWYASQLCKLAEEIGRPLRLAVRGGTHLHVLRRAFAQVLSIDSTPYQKTMRRRRAVVVTGSSRLFWRRSVTLKGQLIDDLLQLNLNAVLETKYPVADRKRTKNVA